MVVVERRLTLDDVERMIKQGELDEDQQYELVDGELVCLPMPSLYHHEIIWAIIDVILPFARQIGAKLYSEGGGFRAGGSGQNLRYPDISLTTKDRIGILRIHPLWGIEAPDLAIEVLSPEQYGERYARDKVSEYLSAGGKVVWLVNPANKSVRAFVAGSDEVVTYSGDAEITLDAIVPGFRAPVSAFFPEL